MFLTTLRYSGDFSWLEGNCYLFGQASNLSAQSSILSNFQKSRYFRYSKCIFLFTIKKEFWQEYSIKICGSFLPQNAMFGKAARFFWHNCLVYILQEEICIAPTFHHLETNPLLAFFHGKPWILLRLKSLLTSPYERCPSNSCGISFVFHIV